MATEAGKKVDQVWAVFDKDHLDKVEKTRENFEQAFVKAAEENIRIAYSNKHHKDFVYGHGSTNRGKPQNLGLQVGHPTQTMVCFLQLQIGSSTLVDDLIQFTSDIEEHLRVKEVDFADGIVEVIDAVSDVVG